MYCTKCGRENSEGVKFCIHCGAKMEETMQANQEAAPFQQSEPPKAAEAPEAFGQPVAAEPEQPQPTVTEQPAAEQSMAEEQPMAAEQFMAEEQPMAAEQFMAEEQPITAEQPAEVQEGTEQAISEQQPEAVEQPMAAEQSMAVGQSAAVEQSMAAEQPTAAEQPMAAEQSTTIEQPWMASQPRVVEQSWMSGAAGMAAVQMPETASVNVPPAQTPQTNVSPVQMGQAPIQNGQPPQMGQAPMPNGQMPPLGQAPMPNGQMPPLGQPMLNGQPFMPNGQVPPIQGRPPMPYSAVPPANPTQKKGNGAVKVILGIILALLVVGIGVVAFIFINKNSQEKKLQTQLETAADYTADGSYEEAVAAYLEVLEKNPENSEAIDGLTDTYLKWAERYAKDENYEEAISILKGADDHARSKTLKKKISEYEEALEALAAKNRTGFVDEDLVFRQGSNELTVELNHAFIVRSSGSYYTSYADASYEEYGEYETDRGLALGDSLEDYLTLYEVLPGYAAWELYSGENNEYTSFAEYTGQTPADMYASYNNVWLDIGFSRENGEWRALSDFEIKETWFCDAPLSDYEEVIVFAVNFNDWGEVIGLSLEHFSYDQGWVDWQGWDSGDDYDGYDDYGYTGNREEFTDADLLFSNGSNTVEVSLNHSFIVYAQGSQIVSYVDADYETTEDVYFTNRGLALGMMLEDYRDLYYVEPGYAVWELFRGENNEYTSFAEYTGQSPADMYDGTYNNAWLDIGFCKENGEWRAMLDVEVRDTWFCDADLDAYEEVVVFAVNLDEWGEVKGLSLEHFTYDEGWVDWQGWAN